MLIVPDWFWLSARVMVGAMTASETANSSIARAYLRSCLGVMVLLGIGLAWK
jgi:threonine/homoserine/homoserine lactone efflux protein